MRGSLEEGAVVSPDCEEIPSDGAGVSSDCEDFSSESAVPEFGGLSGQGVSEEIARKYRAGAVVVVAGPSRAHI